MGESRVFSCDVQGCEAQRREVNHWWLCCVTKPSMLKSNSFHAVTFSEFHYDAWKAWPDVTELAITCGEQHAMELYSCWLAHGSFHKPKGESNG